ncbi:MAG: hypothetical protein JKY80_09315 [Mariprofundaceae bacterium]|nr:hypothetical protein [Mariprofundaceae bacterium]
MSKSKTFFKNTRGIKVTQDTLSTRYKDEALAPIQSVRIGREPLIVGGICGAGLILFCYQFGDLLYFTEKLTITFLGILILVAGFSIAALRIGQYMHEKTVFWDNIWTVQKVRHAIAKAKQSVLDNNSTVLIEGDSGAQ